MPGRQEPSTINESLHHKWKPRVLNRYNFQATVAPWNDEHTKNMSHWRNEKYIYFLIISPFNNFLYFILTNMPGRQESFYHKWKPCWTDATFKQQLLLETMSIPKICHIEETKNIFFNNITFSLLQLFNILSNFLYFISFV